MIDLLDKLQDYTINTTTGCWEFNQARGKGRYGVIRMDGVSYYTHRLVADIFIEPVLKYGCRREIHHILIIINYYTTTKNPHYNFHSPSVRRLLLRDGEIPTVKIKHGSVIAYHRLTPKMLL